MSSFQILGLDPLSCRHCGLTLWPERRSTFQHSSADKLRTNSTGWSENFDRKPQRQKSQRENFSWLLVLLFISIIIAVVVSQQKQPFLAKLWFVLRGRSRYLGASLRSRCDTILPLGSKLSLNSTSLEHLSFFSFGKKIDEFFEQKETSELDLSIGLFHQKLHSFVHVAIAVVQSLANNKGLVFKEQNILGGGHWGYVSWVYCIWCTYCHIVIFF